MNFDRTFCVSEKCALAKRCDRHDDRIKEWTGKEKKVVHRISMADFYKADEVCKWYGDTGVEDVENIEGLK